MQLIRNSVAHGIEKAEERLAKGKNGTGKIWLSIKLLDDKIHVRLADDGKGLDYNKIREKALKLQLIKKEDGENKDILLKAIFSPGFSTAENEGMHAGRGVGLNLVRDRVREAKGSIKLQSEAGKGTVFNLFFPV
jgi:chemotaxis protein histidine kinase CheA